jgi:mono/diheme cytochrome c family protein
MAEPTDDVSSRAPHRAKTFLWTTAGFILAVAIGTGIGYFRRQAPEPLPPISGAPQADILARGQYLARAADCVACHTSEFGKPFSGGRAFRTPFGTLYSTNITSDKEHGIGAWDDDAFVSAVREGIGSQGNLYPAMPYTSYTAMSRDDVLAIKSYLMSLEPVAEARQVNKIGFPFNQRWGLKLWNFVFFKNQRFEENSSLSVELNRGAYLTNALGHCGECHTPRNFGFAMSESQAFIGAHVEGWLAPNLTSDALYGLGVWSDDQLIAYLKTGHARGRSSASGPMAEVIEHSLQYLNDIDLRSMVIFLRSLQKKVGEVPYTTVVSEGSANSSAVGPALGSLKSDVGLKLFAGDCAGCHLWNGTGRQSEYADLVGARAVNDPSGSNIVMAILNGSRISVGNQRMEMPGFRDKYSNEQIAALANYVLQHFGGTSGVVTGENVQGLREQ